MNVDVLADDIMTLIRIFKSLEQIADNDVQTRAIRRLKTMLKELVSHRRVLRAQRVPWRILPPGKAGARKAAQYYRRLQSLAPELRVEEARLRFMEELDADSVFIGQDSFDGYICFFFAKQNVAVLECPFYGEAAYILQSDWRALSHYSKSELLTHFKAVTTRVIHTSRFHSNFRYDLRRVGVTI